MESVQAIWSKAFSPVFRVLSIAFLFVRAPVVVQSKTQLSPIRGGSENSFFESPRNRQSLADGVADRRGGVRPLGRRPYRMSLSYRSVLGALIPPAWLMRARVVQGPERPRNILTPWMMRVLSTSDRRWYPVICCRSWNVKTPGVSLDTFSDPGFLS